TFPGAAFSFLPAPLATAYSEASRPGVSNDQLSSPRPLYRLNLKINAIGSAVEELAIWGEQQGSTETSDAVKPHLDTPIENAGFISEALVELAI
ncbi:hypothetical protein, partial [Pseudomonas aeruginosa]|uniref:hypothetical protein n=1 Tax=Pseudomonas aeruginosa TaxID=287 RepID=UPI00106D9F5F